VGQVGTFQSPFHPNVYPHGVNCTWFITVTPGFIIRLTFNAFTLEHAYNCNWDYVEIFDNYTTSASLGRYCGVEIPPVITSTNNVLVVTFVTDSSVAREGFSLPM
jgi:cubilin